MFFSFSNDITKKNQICCSFADALQETLGFDWLLLFIQAHLHNTTVVRATRILVTMLSSTPALNRFREGLGSGSWLDGTDIMLNKTTYVVAGMRMIYIYFLFELPKRFKLEKQPLSRFICRACMRGNFWLFCSFSPKLPGIHFG